jgi:hypothetical protein
MAFIRKRASGSETYTCQVIEAYRENGQPKQRILCNLGPCGSIDERIADLRQQAMEIRNVRGLELDAADRKARLAWLTAEIAKLENVRDHLADRQRSRAA